MQLGKIDAKHQLCLQSHRFAADYERSFYKRADLQAEKRVVDSRKNSISDSRVLSDFNRRRIAREGKVFPPPNHFTAEPHASIRATQDIDVFPAFYLFF